MSSEMLIRYECDIINDVIQKQIIHIHFLTNQFPVTELFKNCILLYNKMIISAMAA